VESLLRNGELSELKLLPADAGPLPSVEEKNEEIELKLPCEFDKSLTFSDVLREVGLPIFGRNGAPIGLRSGLCARWGLRGTES
jgi:hypothetical protein